MSSTCSCSYRKLAQILYNMAIIKPDIIKNNGVIKESSPHSSFTQEKVAKFMYDMAIIKPDIVIKK